MKQYNDNLRTFDNVKYVSDKGKWHNSFNNALSDSSKELSWDLTAVVSMLSLNFVCGELTLIKEIKKNPWLSTINSNNKIDLFNIPSHDYMFENKRTIADKLFDLLVYDLSNACKDHRDIYLLLSGGMDSRIVACAISEGIKKGIISSNITTITWGLPDSNELKIAERVARELNFEWKNIELTPQILLKNIGHSARQLGCFTNGGHIHGMSWFENVSNDSLVIAGTYGNGIGRAEYSGKHLLELNLLNPVNKMDLIKNEFYGPLKKDLLKVLQILRSRYTWKRKHEIVEVENHCHYIRNMMAHTMNIISNYCNLYQAFTSSNIYSYIWSLHPSLRNDGIYAHILKKTNKNVAQLPYARTRRALAGKTLKLDLDLSASKGFSLYREWISDQLFDELYQKINMDLLNDLEIFNVVNIQKLCEDVRNKTQDYHKYNFFLWLISFSEFNSFLKENKKEMCNKFMPDIIYDKKKEDFFMPAKFNKKSKNLIKKIINGLFLNKEFLKLIIKKTVLLYFLFYYPPKFKKRIKNKSLS